MSIKQRKEEEEEVDVIIGDEYGAKEEEDIMNMEQWRWRRRIRRT